MNSNNTEIHEENEILALEDVTLEDDYPDDLLWKWTLATQMYKTPSFDKINWSTINLQMI